jgi:hypothetical protein
MRRKEWEIVLEFSRLCHMARTEIVTNYNQGIDALVAKLDEAEARYIAELGDKVRADLLAEIAQTRADIEEERRMNTLEILGFPGTRN